MERSTAGKVEHTGLAIRLLKMVHDYDIVIIGGGFAGVTAARELSGQGLRIALLEAKDRLGGRAWFREWHNYPIEMGGGWVYWTQPHVWSEITRYGLELFERPGWPKNYEAPIYAMVDGEVVARPMAENMAALFPLIDEYAADAPNIFPRPFDPHASINAIQEVDHLSAQDRLDQMEMPDLQRVLMGRMLAMQSHGDPQNGAYIEFLRWYALSHFSTEIYLSTASRLQFQEGSRSLIEAMINDSEATVYLNWPVTAVEQNEAGVQISHQNGELLTAKKAIIALPINVWKDIKFSPKLSNEKQALSREEHTGKGQKIYVRIKGLWPDLNMAADSTADICTVIVQEAREQETLLVIFLVNDNLAPFTQEKIEAGLRRFLPEVEVIDMISHNWADDEFAQGTWCGYRPGQTSGYLAQAQASEGHLHFAGADIANGWRGFFDGAIETGLTVANQLRGKRIN